MTFDHWNLKSWKSTRRAVCATILLSFAVGFLVAARLAHINHVQADSNRLFEMHLYHALPGKLPAFESQFRNTTSKLLAKHDLKIVGYWVVENTPAWDNTFMFIVANSSQEEATKNWDAMRADPDFQELVRKNSDPATKLVDKIDVLYMRPTDFSPMK
jgi:hypothetical protein